MSGNGGVGGKRVGLGTQVEEIHDKSDRRHVYENIKRKMRNKCAQPKFKWPIFLILTYLLALLSLCYYHQEIVGRGGAAYKWNFNV